MAKKLNLKLPKKREGRLDKYVNHLLLKNDLSDDKLEYLQKMKFAFTALLTHSKETVLRMLIEEYDLAPAQPYRIINDAREVFGNVEEADKKALKYMQSQRLMKLYEIALEKEQYDNALTILREYNKINDLHTSETDEQNIKVFIQSLQQTNVFSDNPKFLQQEETEDVEYEESE